MQKINTPINTINKYKNKSTKINTQIKIKKKYNNKNYPTIKEVHYSLLLC